MIVKYAIVAWIALSVLLVVGYVGKPRGPITPGSAALAVAIHGAIIAAIIVCWPTT